MLKKIPKSDISVRPFKAYKKWSFNELSFPISSSLEINERIAIYSASFNVLDTSYVTMSYSSSNYPNGNIYKYYPKSLYGQLKAQFYNDNIDNPFLRFGVKSTEYVTGSGSERFITGSAKILSIPQIYVGEGIKKGSVTLVDNGTTYIDDSNGNLIGAAGDSVTYTVFNNETGNATFFDILNNQYDIVVTNVNFDTGNITGTYLGEQFSAIMSSFNLETGIMVVNNFGAIDKVTNRTKFFIDTICNCG